MFSTGFKKVAGTIGQGLLNSAKRVAQSAPGKKAIMSGAVHGAAGGAIVGAATNKDEYGNAAPLSGALKGAVGGAAAGGAMGLGKGMYNRSKVTSSYVPSSQAGKAIADAKLQRKTFKDSITAAKVTGEKNRFVNAKDFSSNKFKQRMEA